MLATLRPVVDAVLAAAARRGEAWRDPDVDQLLAVLEQDYAGVAAADPEELRQVAAVFRLGSLEVDLLRVALAAEADATLAAVLARLDGDRSRTRPTVGLALELCGASSLDPSARSRLAGAAPLRRFGLLDLPGDRPLLQRPLQLPERVAAALLGDRTPDPVTAAVLVEATPITVSEATPLSAALATGAPFCYVEDRHGAVGPSLAAAAFDLADMAHFVVDLRRRPGDTSARQVLEAVLLEAGLVGCGVVVDGFEVAVEADPSLCAVAARHPVPVVAVAYRLWDSGWPRPRPYVCSAPRLNRAERTALWTGLGIEKLEDAETQWQDLLLLNLSPRDIREAFQAARAEAAVLGRPPRVADVRDAVRSLSGPAAKELARPGRTRPRLHDLVVPTYTREMLEELIAWARLRESVLAQGPVAGKGDKGSGITGMFTGPPGTGKTLSAQIIASELEIELYTVQLPGIIDKYIGETEKNLEKVFAHAEQLNCVLFFDEADALFGSRSAVRDARDRYANQEVSYLLQRMEHFDGITILSTNAQGNLDRAFMRRLHFIVHFLDPDQPARRALWQTHLDALSGLDPADPPELDELARDYELSGGEIRNVVLAAAYGAARTQSPVGQALLRSAAVREYRKLGRRDPPGGQ